MLRLDLTASAPRWVEVAPGIRFHCLPVETETTIRARQKLLDEGMDLTDQTAVMLRVGLLVAIDVITDWEGIGDLQGRPIKPTPEAITTLLRKHTTIWDAFEQKVIAPAMLLDAEKNASAPSPNGSAAGAKATAKAARPAARSARRK